MNCVVFWCTAVKTVMDKLWWHKYWKGNLEDLPPWVRRFRHVVRRVFKSQVKELMSSFWEELEDLLLQKGFNPEQICQAYVKVHSSFFSLSLAHFSFPETYLSERAR